MRNPFKALFIAIYWFSAGYFMMNFSTNPFDAPIVGSIAAITGLILWAYVEAWLIKGQPVDARLRRMIFYTPLAMIGLGLAFFIVENGG